MSKAVSTKSPEKLIKHYQEQMSACEMSFVENAYEAGKVLIDQKKKLDHGEFSDWCREHWKKSRRTATDYMLLAENLKPKQISECVSIKQAKKLLTSKSATIADLNQELPVNGHISADVEQEATSGDSPPDPVQNGAVESSVERQPGDESEEGGVDPIVKPPKTGSTKDLPGPVHKQAVSSYFSPLARATKKLADMNGGEGPVYREAKQHLNAFSAAFKKLGKGEQ